MFSFLLDFKRKSSAERRHVGQIRFSLVDQLDQVCQLKDQIWPTASFWPSRDNHVPKNRKFPKNISKWSRHDCIAFEWVLDIKKQNIIAIYNKKIVIFIYSFNLFNLFYLFYFSILPNKIVPTIKDFRTVMSLCQEVAVLLGFFNYYFTTRNCNFSFSAFSKWWKYNGFSPFSCLTSCQLDQLQWSGAKIDSTSSGRLCLGCFWTRPRCLWCDGAR